MEYIESVLGYFEDQMSNNGAKTRWKKGQSGNPKGRQKGAGKAIIGLGDSVAFIGRVATDSAISATKKDGQVVHSTRLLRWTNTLMERADAGDVRAIRTILGYAAQWDRAREKATQKVGKKGGGKGALTSAHKLKFRAFAELQFESSPAPIPTKAPPKPVPRPVVDPNPPPDYATWLKLHPDEPRRPPDPPTNDAQRAGEKQAKEQAE
jgi:Family of unknown function (DUF5681)